MKKITVLFMLAVLCFVMVSSESVGAIPRRGRSPAFVPPRVQPPVMDPIVAKPLGPDHPKRVAQQLKKDADFGLMAGWFAGLPALTGELRFHKFLDIDAAAAKLGVRYAQGDDANKVMRKYALVFADGAIDLNSGPGPILYAAGGVNYLAYTTGKKQGSVGGEAYLGVRDGGLYAEAGYGAIRTGFDPTVKGLIFSAGFKHRY
jgi:hypothetical protein